jgi:hypothetical protein
MAAIHQAELERLGVGISLRGRRAATGSVAVAALTPLEAYTFDVRSNSDISDVPLHRAPARFRVASPPRRNRNPCFRSTALLSALASDGLQTEELTHR